MFILPRAGFLLTAGQTYCILVTELAKLANNDMVDGKCGEKIHGKASCYYSHCESMHQDASFELLNIHLILIDIGDDSLYYILQTYKPIIPTTDNTNI